MPITFQCPCGRKFRTADENAGRSAACPDCRTRFVVPATAAVPAAPAPILPPPPEVVPVESEPPACPVDSVEVTPTPRRAAPSSPYGRSDRDDPGDRDGPPRRRRPYRDDDIRDRIVRKPPPSSNFMGGAGVLGGLAMMAIAVVWFFGAGLLHVWFIYPPFLFIAGLVCLIRGCVSGKL